MSTSSTEPFCRRPAAVIGRALVPALAGSASPFQRPVPPQARRDPLVATSTVELRDELIRLNLVMVAPPPVPLVIPNPPTARHASGHVSAPAQRGTGAVESLATWASGTDTMSVACRAASGTA